MSINNFINFSDHERNFIIENFNYEYSELMLKRFNDEFHIELLNKFENNKIKISTISEESRETLLKFLNKAIKNIELYSENSDTCSALYMKIKRKNRKWYQFWLNKTDEEIAKAVKMDKSFFSGSDFGYIKQELLYNLKKELNEHRSVILMNKELSYDSSIKLTLSAGRFKQFLHFLNRDSRIESKVQELYNQFYGIK